MSGVARAFRLSPVAFCRRLTLDGWDRLLAAEEAGAVTVLAPADGPWPVGLRAFALYRPTARLVVAPETSPRHRRLLAAAWGERTSLGEPTPGDGAVLVARTVDTGAGGWRLVISPGTAAGVALAAAVVL